MRSLFVTRHFIDDGEHPVNGVYQRMGMFLEAVSLISTHLDLLVFSDPLAEINSSNISKWSEIYKKWVKCSFNLHVVPRNPPSNTSGIGFYINNFWDYHKSSVLKLYECCGTSQVSAVRRLLSSRPDLIFAHRLPSMTALLAAGAPHGQILFDLDDIEHRAFVRHILAPPHWKTKKLAFLHLPALMAIERRALRAARVTYVCSAVDRDAINRTRGVNAQSVPNAVTISDYSPVPKDPILMFLGTGRFSANRVAVDYFIAEIWSRIFQAVPGVRFLVGGEFPELFKDYRSPPPGVEFLGFVDDLPALYKSARLVVAPILSGAGTRFKIIEAAASARPIVSTTIGAEGLALADGDSIFLRDNPQSFADACIEILRNPSTAQRLADAGLEVARNEYDRASIIGRLVEQMRSTTGKEA